MHGPFMTRACQCQYDERVSVGGSSLRCASQQAHCRMHPDHCMCEAYDSSMQSQCAHQRCLTWRWCPGSSRGRRASCPRPCRAASAACSRGPPRAGKVDFGQWDACHFATTVLSLCVQPYKSMVPSKTANALATHAAHGCHLRHKEHQVSRRG